MKLRPSCPPAGALAADGLQTLQENLNFTLERYEDFRIDEEGRVNRGERKYKGSVFANYTFQSPRLTGFSVGGGLRYQGRSVIGYDLATNQPFIDRHAHEPFFLYIPFTAPHGPPVGPEPYHSRFEHLEQERRRRYAADENRTRLQESA